MESAAAEAYFRDEFEVELS